MAQSISSLKSSRLQNIGIAATASTVSSATTATTATKATTSDNLSGGSVGSIPYQTGSDQTAQLGAGVNGYFLKSNGAAAPSWVSPKEVIGLADGKDVAITAPESGQVLTYDGTNWINSAPVSGGGIQMVLDGTVLNIYLD